MTKLVTLEEYKKFPEGQKISYLTELVVEYGEAERFPREKIIMRFEEKLRPDEFAGAYALGNIVLVLPKYPESPQIVLALLAHELGHHKDCVKNYKCHSIQYDFEVSPIVKEPAALKYGYDFAKKWGIADIYLQREKSALEAYKKGYVPEMWKPLAKEIIKALEEAHKEIAEKPLKLRDILKKKSFKE